MLAAFLAKLSRRHSQSTGKVFELLAGGTYIDKAKSFPISGVQPLPSGSTLDAIFSAILPSLTAGW